jgi:hypothetical protein
MPLILMSADIRKTTGQSKQALFLEVHIPEQLGGLLDSWTVKGLSTTLRKSLTQRTEGRAGKTSVLTGMACFKFSDSWNPGP